MYRLDVRFEEGLDLALAYNASMEEQPSEVDVLLAEAGLKGPLTPLTPLTPPTPLTPDEDLSPPTIDLSAHSDELSLKLQHYLDQRLRTSTTNSPMSTANSSTFTQRTLRTCPQPSETRLKATHGAARPAVKKSKKHLSEQMKAVARDRKKRRRDRKRQAKAKARRAEQEASGLRFTPASEYRVRASLSKKFFAARAEKLDTETEQLPACEGAWKAKLANEDLRVVSLQEALGMGLKLLEWDGRCAVCSSSFSLYLHLRRSPILLVDRSERIVAVLVGKPADVEGRESWNETVQKAFEAMQRLEADMRWNGSQVLPKPPNCDGTNRRGDYHSSSHGPSFGGGQSVSYVW